ncbi:hypothetical protein RHGRI_000360 [Rhododendron griersonianum]|uniref:Uncharacterized protein n=1 Tax=Rhododendron griersonianum TaxID=479676 RepID=A0AAV6LGA1_9ERIC|nr:hypothetical protein RHGRI_000360 [Rhododendron griersonianum]
MVLGLAYHGYAWTLVDPTANRIGLPGRGPAVTLDGSMSYRWLADDPVVQDAAQDLSERESDDEGTKEGILADKTWVGFVDTDRVADDDGEESSREELFATMDRVLEEAIINLRCTFASMGSKLDKA